MENHRLLTKEQAVDACARESWGEMTTLASRDTLGCPDMTVLHVIIRRGMANPRHSHQTCQEVLHLLRGQLDYYVGDTRVVVRPGDTLVIDAGVPHYGDSVGEEDAELITAFSAGVRDFRPE